MENKFERTASEEYEGEREKAQTEMSQKASQETTTEITTP